MTTTTALTEKAYWFAWKYHGDIYHKRKYTGEPYIFHPVNVALTLRSVGITDEHVIAAAFLHDTVEDTEVTLDMIQEEFGTRVHDMIKALSDDPFIEGVSPNRAARKKMDRERLGAASADVHNIKVADLIDNSVSIIEHDPKFAKVYLKEKALLLDVLTKADSVLLAQAREML